MTDKIAATTMTTTRRVETSRPPIDRTGAFSRGVRFESRLLTRWSRRALSEDFSPVVRAAFFRSALPALSCLRAEASSSFAACAAALRWRDFSALISRVVRAHSEAEERRRGEGREEGRRLAILLSCPMNANLAHPTP